MNIFKGLLSFVFFVHSGLQIVFHVKHAYSCITLIFMKREVILTTSDNPFDPYYEYEEWDSYDRNVLGYNTNAYLARMCYTSPDIPDNDIAMDQEDAINRILALNVTGTYKKNVYINGKLQS